MFGFLFPMSYRSNTMQGPTQGDVRSAAQDAIIPLEQRMQALELTCAGLWALLQQKHGYTDEELMAAIHEVDGRDGQVDGKIGHAVKECPHCHRKLLTRNPTRCAWCGAALDAKPF